MEQLNDIDFWHVVQNNVKMISSLWVQLAWFLCIQSDWNVLRVVGVIFWTWFVITMMQHCLYRAFCWTVKFKDASAIVMLSSDVPRQVVMLCACGEFVADAMAFINAIAPAGASIPSLYSLIPAPRPICQGLYCPMMTKSAGKLQLVCTIPAGRRDARGYILQWETCSTENANVFFTCSFWKRCTNVYTKHECSKRERERVTYVGVLETLTPTSGTHWRFF